MVDDHMLYLVRQQYVADLRTSIVFGWFPADFCLLLLQSMPYASCFAWYAGVGVS